MPLTLVHSCYGKARVRLAHVTRGPQQHEFKELDVWVQFAGDYDRAYIAGDNSNTLPTDTMKNTVYAFAKEHPPRQNETFSLGLADHFLRNNPDLRQVRVKLVERLWTRVQQGRKEHPHAFQSSPDRRTAFVLRSRESATVRSGIRNLAMLKTTGSAFEGFMRDNYTTLRATRDRILAPVLQVSWLYEDASADFDDCWLKARDALIQVFVDHQSRSAQHTVYAMGQEVLRRCSAIREISISWANKHNLLVDLSQFDLNNEDEVFMPVNEPHGLIEATIARS